MARCWPARRSAPCRLPLSRSHAAAADFEHSAQSRNVFTKNVEKQLATSPGPVVAGLGNEAMVELDLVEERIDRLSRLEIEPTTIIGSEIAASAGKLGPSDGI